MRTLTLAVAALSSGLYVMSFPLMMAAATFVILPVILAFVFSQRFPGAAQRRAAQAEREPVGHQRESHMSDKRTRIGQVGDSWRAAAEDDDDLLHRVPLTSHLEPPFGLSRVEDMTFKMDRLTGSLTQATRSRATT